MATYYINADTGNDTTGDGSSSLPWLTLSKANSSSISGDTIFCQNATNTYSWPSANLAGKLLQGENVNSVIFDANLSNPSLTVDGCTIKNCTFRNLVNTTNQTGGFRKVGSLDTIFNNCIFYDNTTTTSLGGVFWFGVSPGSTSNTTITGCLFYGITSNIFAQGSSNENYLNINNSVIHFDNASSPILRLFNGYGGSAIYTQCKNVIFYNTQGSDVGLARYGSTTLNYCCTLGSFSSYVDGGTNINQDPLFIDAANRNYNLSPSSPCIDAGTLV